MSKSTFPDIGKRLTFLRKAKGIKTQTAMAALIGAEVSQYNNWERGLALMPVGYGMKICSVTGAGLDFIYRGDLSGLPANLMTLLTEEASSSAASDKDAALAARASTSRKRSSK